ncbi:lamin tail domain-containing protein [Crocinitomix algicola]|uniref:lamin tail domain-containing protein n=1 Tax=Crocinitomix algicola TaxID=1740263 RepID=UPI00082A052B|nr:lamin tail domain-containing protein [Crocinitomix algicola]
MRFYLTLGILFVAFVTKAQFSENFGDGNFDTDPVWIGVTDNFIVNADNQLQLNAPPEADTSYLVTNSTVIDDVTWDFWIRMAFNPSSSNLVRVYLVTDQENLKDDLNGYFVQVGNTDDEISLYRQSGATITKIIDGINDVVDLADVNVRIRVTRDALGNWELLRDATGGYSFVSEGTVLDNTHLSSAYFGVFCKYTSTRSDKFFFDELGTPYIDTTPPTVETITVVSPTSIRVFFSEPVNGVTAENTSNYFLDNGAGNPISAVRDAVDFSQVDLTFDSPLLNATWYNLEVNNVEDLDDNIIDPTVEEFFYFIPELAFENDLVFSELMIDPSPIVGLPEVEFIEIFNRSDKVFELENWTINDNSTMTTLPSYIIEPNQYLVLCGLEEGELFGIDNYIELAGLPTLTNAEDYIVIKNNEGLLIDSVFYNQTWYNNNDKDDGGWTLERINMEAPCSGKDNWSASEHPSGGTPGSQNSIWSNEDDVQAPVIAFLEVLNDNEIIISFNENLDTTIDLEIEINPTAGGFEGEFLNFDSYRLYDLTLEENTYYTLTVSGGQDCWGNLINDQIQFGLPGNPEQGDIILNEILFNPQTGGTDYVELVNISDKIIDLNKLFIANWDDQIDNYELIGAQQHLLFPNEYALLSEDSTQVIDYFAVYGVGQFIDTDLPSFPNDSATVYLLNSDSTMLDYFHYDDDDHYPLLNSTDGKALERITFGGGLNNSNNWHTASENVQWGTPGYLNSQFAAPIALGEVSIDPQIFSPDEDGYEDVLTINFKLTNVDNNIDVSIYDNQGRLIKKLADNYFIGQNGLLIWDGINEDGEKAAIGTYIILIDVKNKEGIRSQFKKVAVLAGRL